MAGTALLWEAGGGHYPALNHCCPQEAALRPLTQSTMAAVWRALSALRPHAVPRSLHTACSLHNSNRTSVTHLRRQVYGRLYPLLLVRTDGSTVHIRYKEPKKILMLPVDSSTLPEAERKARLRRQFPSKLRARQEEALEELDLEKYKKFWKK
ncbi:39S ribosomal protein L55, mitochondrial isoform X2 [Numida meleagris]|uniref:39S ribosomal protein L55, mitochondrial isoform X2 n=1 Tax=Numida meleagris TaxID=8996 RepID=UPI000B3DD9B5|nr:39S ribosomal protein L55, mitochondrial isoform X2 [Numida meleagris]